MNGSGRLWVPLILLIVLAGLAATHGGLEGITLPQPQPGGGGPDLPVAGQNVQGTGNLAWHRGQVQHHPSSYVIFWGKEWSQNKPTIDIIDRYFQNVGGTAFENIMTQYGDQAGEITNTHDYHSYVVDQRAIPTDNSCGAATVSDTMIQREINAVLGSDGWWQRDSANATYYLYTPPGYQIRMGNDCSNRVFCGYHGWARADDVAYAVMEYPTSSGCKVPRSPNNNTAADSIANITSHEQFEAVTDPIVGDIDAHAFGGPPPSDGNPYASYRPAWYDSAGYEIGDKCNGDYSSGMTKLNNNAIFAVQTEYSNATRSCVNRYP